MSKLGLFQSSTFICFESSTFILYHPRPSFFTGPLSNFLDRPLSCVHFHAISCVHFHGFELSSFSLAVYFLDRFLSNFWVVRFPACPIFEAYDDINSLNHYWQFMENSSRNISEIFIFRVVTQTVLLENSSIRFFLLKPYMICNIWSGWVFH